jgi:hypothetical protein
MVSNMFSELVYTSEGLPSASIAGNCHAWKQFLAGMLEHMPIELITPTKDRSRRTVWPAAF